MISALVLFLAAGAAEPMDCDGVVTQRELNICAHSAYEAADDELNAQWKIAGAFMKERDHELVAGDRRPKHFDTLLAAQTAWIAFREQHCLLEGFAMRDGSAEPMVRSGCLHNLTRARTAQLKSLIETGN